MATVNPNAIVSFNSFRLGHSKSSFLMFKMTNTQIVLADDGIGKEIKNWNDFVEEVKPQGAAWFAYRFGYETVDGGKRSKMMLIQWIGKSATPVEKMQYAMFTNVLRKSLQGVDHFVQAHGEGELDEKEILARVSRFECEKVVGRA